MIGFDIFGPPFSEIWLLGAAYTVGLTTVSWLIAVVMGIAIALLRVSHRRWLGFFGSVYVSYQQNIPVLVHIMVWYFAFPTLLPDPVNSWINDHHGGFIFSAIAIGLCLSAYVAEDLRSGFRAVSVGQTEAAQSLGLGYVTIAKDIIVPQAFRNALPSFVNHSVLLFKNTSLAMVVGVTEFTYTVTYVRTATFQIMDVYIAAAVFYVAISLMIMAAGAILERRLNVSRGMR